MEKIFKDKGSYLEFDKFSNIGIYFTTREGGVSRGEFASNNMAYQVGDIKEDVFKNREEFAKSIGMTVEDFVFANQVHGIKIVEVTKAYKGAGRDSFESGIEKTDVLYTYEKDLALACFYADCTPVYFVDEKSGLVGIIHAGWQGVCQDIIEVVLIKLRDELNIDLKELKFVVGPSIRKESFEVKEDTLEKFEGKKYVQGDVIIKNDKIHIDLVKYIENTFEKFGINKENVYVCDIDTNKATNMFSFRREGTTGRMIGVIRKW